MKAKLIILAILIIGAGMTSNAQIHFGICGGSNNSWYKSDDVLTTDNNYEISFPSDNNLGFHLGLISQFEFFNFFIQPEVVYTKLRHNIKINDLSTNDYDQLTEEILNRIDIPVLIGYKFSVLKLELGPVASFLISDNSDFEKITTYDMQFNKATIGYQAGIGLQVSKLVIDFKYEGSLGNLGKGISVGDSDIPFDSRTHQFIVDVGILF
jgi:hypothetical protein